MQTQRQSDNSKVITLLKVTGVGVVCGVGFGFVMSIVSNLFVIGVKWLTGLRETNPFGTISFGGTELSLAPLISLVLAALLILLVRRIFRISAGTVRRTASMRRTAPITSSMCGPGSARPWLPLFRQVAVPRLVNMARWCISGRRWGASSVRRQAGF